MNGHHALAEAIRRHGQSPANSFSLPRSATISSYNPKTYAVKVLIQPENVESNWMPLGSIAVGGGWGVAIGPQIGDQVLVVFQEGDFSSGVVVARLFSVAANAPTVASGEMALQHSSGSLLKFNADGSVNVTSSGALNVTAGGNLSANVAGNLTATVSGSMSVVASGAASIQAASIALKNSGAALKALLNASLLTWLNSHVHGNGNGGANTTAPTTTPAATVQTSTVQAE